MSRSLLLGIDLGTTVLKVCAFDARTGAVRAQATERLKVDMRPEGGREQSPATVKRAFIRATTALRSRLDGAWSRVCGIGLAAQGGSTIIVDRETGRPRTPMYLWNDARGGIYIPEVIRRFPASFWRRLALRDVPPAGLGRLLWLRDQDAGLFTDENMHSGAGEFLFFQLTGLWRQDAGHAIQIGAYDAGRQRLNGTPLDLVGMPLSFVAPLRKGHETAPLSASGARWLELPEGIPVAGPYIDQEAGYLSSAATAGRPLQCSFGTAWVGNFVLPQGATGRSTTQLTLPSPLGEGRLVVQPLLTGNATWDWALQTFIGGSHSKALAQSAALFDAALLPPAGLFAVPWMAQPNPKFPEAFGGGAFWGVSANTLPADMLRAVAVGLAFELARVFLQLRDKKAVDSVVLSGGASKGAHFRMLASSLFAPLPVHLQTDEDLAAARGALYTFGGEACRGRVAPIAPPDNRTNAAIGDAFARYRDVFDELFGTVPQGQPFRLGGSK